MGITLLPGKYIVAVSGGVDSMVLLHMLVKQVMSYEQRAMSNDKNGSRQAGQLQLIVAHFDHGIREDSPKDRELVQKIAAKHGLQFEFGEGHLGASASEATARTSRYELLHAIRQKYKADAIVTAHHQDDLIETALLNVLRGTGRKGLSSLQSTDVIKRPLLQHSKRQILDYAKDHGVIWREDVTNQDTNYLRNYVRHNCIPRLTPDKRMVLVDLLESMHNYNQELDVQIANLLQFLEADSAKINRLKFIVLPHIVAREVMASWLRSYDIRDFNSKTIERLVVAAKTLQPGQRMSINKVNYLFVDKLAIALLHIDR